MDYSAAILKIADELKDFKDKGKVADYIPELGLVNPDRFGVNLTTCNDENFSYGDSEEKFSIQSIAKVLSLILAYNLEGEKLWKRVGVEPSGTPFNSLVQLEHDNGIPRNPFINSGALVVCDVLFNYLDDPKRDFIELVRKVAHNSKIKYSEKIAMSEKKTGFRNAAVINLMKSFGNINNKVEDVLDLYFNLCSITMTCSELSKTFLFMAMDGLDPYTNRKITSTSKSKRINSIMQLCGFYDEAGEFSFRVGLPGKSGVGGGIVAVNPDKYSIAVWSPRLNKKGNSSMGMHFLERFTSETQSSIF